MPKQLLKPKMLLLSKTTEAEIPQLYELECLCHAQPWTLGILQDCLKVGYLCHTFRFKPDVEINSDLAVLPPIGFMITQVILDECHLLNICVHPDWRGKGIASQALRWLFNFMQEKNMRSMFLEVRASNQAAIKLYQKLGFKQIGIRKNYYRTDFGQEDACIYKWYFEEK